MAEHTSQTETTGGAFHRLKSQISEDFTTTTWVLIPIGIGINTTGSIITNTLKLPLFLDNIGTVLIAILAGPWAAALTGGLGNVIATLLGNPVKLAFVPVPVAIGLTAGFLARRGWFGSVKKVIVPALILPIVATLVATPIVVMVFGGVTGAGASLVTGVILASGQTLVESALSAQLMVEVVDKGGTAFVAYFIGRAVPTQFLPPQGQRVYAK
ncbi:ECF transporter S component [Halegenticoccus tardaugens]|uniref:ECF transporter S component n=1 Tax=Halegenticoccus tardaugens TaxID=2071624 RepID=UPI00100AE0D0|nr:ECF transporter S component [Halegenticoccus tardaugens]